MLINRIIYQQMICGAVYVYILSLALPFYSTIPLIFLSLAGLLTAFTGGLKELKAGFEIKIPLVIFFTSMGLSLIMSPNIQRSLILSLSFLPAILLFFIISEVFDYHRIKYLYVVISIMSVLISVLSVWAIWSSKQTDVLSCIKYMGNPNIVVPNDLIILVITIPFSIVTIQGKSSVAIKILCGLSVLLSIASITLYQSRGALLLSCICFLIMTAYLKSHKILMWAAIILIIIISADFLNGFLLVKKFFNVWNTRLLYWLIAWAMFLDAPVFGHGPRTFGLLFNEYRNQISIPSWLTVDPRHSPWTHNLYLETLCEQGLIGLASILILLGCGLYLSGKTTKSNLEYVRLFGIAAFTGLILICVAGFFELSFIRQWFIIIIFSILGIIVSLLYQPSE